MTNERRRPGHSTLRRRHRNEPFAQRCISSPNPSEAPLCQPLRRQEGLRLTVLSSHYSVRADFASSMLLPAMIERANMSIVSLVSPNRRFPQSPRPKDANAPPRDQSHLLLQEKIKPSIRLRRSDTDVRAAVHISGISGLRPQRLPLATNQSPNCSAQSGVRR